jgi:hypothetical protein
VRRVLLILVLLAGCQTQPRIESDKGSIAVGWSKDLVKGLALWREEIEKHVGPCIILEAHGEYNDSGVWCRYSDDREGGERPSPG